MSFFVSVCKLSAESRERDECLRVCVCVCICVCVHMCVCVCVGVLAKEIEIEDRVLHTIKNLEIIYQVKYSMKEISLRDSSNLIASRTHISSFLAVLTFWKINIGLIKFANKIRQLDK